MAHFGRSSTNPSSGARGSHQLVSEQSDPALESSKEGSFGHGESGGTTTARGRASTVEDRFLSIEGTLEALSESPNPNLHQTPNMHHPTAAQSPNSSIQVSNSPASVHYNHSWNGNSPVMHTAMSVPEQTPEERIRLLTLAFQKYKGDSKSPEEQLQILTATAQKYKARMDSKAFEETSNVRGRNDEVVSILFQSDEDSNSNSSKAANDEDNEDEPVALEFPQDFLVGERGCVPSEPGLESTLDVSPSQVDIHKISLPSDTLSSSVCLVGVNHGPDLVSLCLRGVEFLHHVFEVSLEPKVFQEVSRLLLGFDCGSPLQCPDFMEVAASLFANKRLKNLVLMVWDPGIMLQ